MNRRVCHAPFAGHNSELGVARRSRERNHISDVRSPRNEHQHSFEPKSKAAVRHCSISPEIKVPPVILRAEAVVFHCVCEDIQPFFTLAPPNNLSDSRNQNVHRSRRLPVVIGPHIKRLNLLGIVKHGNWAFKIILGQITFVLGLEICTVLNRVFELLVRFAKDFDGLLVGDSFEGPVKHKLQSTQERLVHELGEQRQIFLTVIEEILD